MYEILITLVVESAVDRGCGRNRKSRSRPRISPTSSNIHPLLPPGSSRCPYGGVRNYTTGHRSLHTPSTSNNGPGFTLLRISRRYHSGTNVLELMLDVEYHYREDKFLSDDLLQALEDRATRNVIRKLHLRCPNRGLLPSIFSSLTPEDETIRDSSRGVESIVLKHDETSDSFASDFFASYRFPKLQHISLSGPMGLSLVPHATTLVKLVLEGPNDVFAAVPPISQIILLLISNPQLQSLTVGTLYSDDDCESVPTPTASLPHLEQLTLDGRFWEVFPILRRLELPERMDNTTLRFYYSDLEGVNQQIIPYIRNYIRCDGRFGDRFGFFITSTPREFELRVCTIGVGCHAPDWMPPQKSPQVEFKIVMLTAPPGAWEEILIDTLTLLPHESVVYLNSNFLVPAAVNAINNMPNIEYLHFVTTPVCKDFVSRGPDGPNGPQNHPSLRWVYLEDVKAQDGYIDPLVTYLTHQTSANRPVSLRVFGKGVHLCPMPKGDLEDSVKELIYEPEPKLRCPFGGCMWGCSLSHSSRLLPQDVHSSGV